MSAAADRVPPTGRRQPAGRRLAAAVRAAAVRRHHAGALPRGAAGRHGRAAGRGRRDRRAPPSRRRSRTPSSPWSGPGGCCARASSGVPQPGLLAVHAAAAGDRAGARAAGGRALRRAPARPGAVRPHRRACTPRGTTAGLDDEARAAGRALPPRLRARRRPARRGRPGAADRAQPGAVGAVDDVRAEPAAGDRGRRRPRRRPRPSWPGSATRRSPPPRGAAADRGLDGYLLTLRAAHRPAGAGQAARPASCAAGCSRRRSPGRRPGEHDNGPVAARIARLRAERARLLGFDTHADLVLADQTARTTAAVDAMLGLDGAAVGGQRRGRGGGRCARPPPATASSSPPGTGRSTASRCAPSATPSTPRALRPWFELDRVLVDGVFHAAELLYGYRFTAAARPRRLPPRRPGLGGRRRRRRARRALPRRLLRPRGQARRGLDELLRRAVPAARHPAGRRQQPQRHPGRRPAQPTLLTLDEVNTLFHEFGHALHGLSSAVTYPRFSGTSVPRDFVEFPSQVNEMWALWPEVLAALRPARRDRRAAAGRRSSRRSTRRSCGVRASRPWSTWPPRCSTRPGTGSPRRPRSATRSSSSAARWRTAGVASDLVPPRYRTTYFQHIFAGGYAAGYYSYIWSEVLDADTVEWFKRERRAAPGERRRLPRPAALRRRLGRPAGRLPRRPRPRRRPRRRCSAAEAWHCPSRRRGTRRAAAQAVDPQRRAARRSRTAPGRGAAQAAVTAVPAGGAVHSQGSASTRSRSSGACALADQPVGLAVAARRAAVHHLPALARLLHQPDRLHRRRHSLARSPGRSSTCSDHRQNGQWLR